jgi:hypothetical protein
MATVRRGQMAEADAWAHGEEISIRIVHDAEVVLIAFESAQNPLRPLQRLSAIHASRLFADISAELVMPRASRSSNAARRGP